MVPSFLMCTSADKKIVVSRSNWCTGVPIGEREIKSSIGADKDMWRKNGRFCRIRKSNKKFEPY